MEAASGKRLAELRADGGAVGERLADAVPGRRAGPAGGGAGGVRDDRAGRGLPGRHRGRACGRSSDVRSMWREAARYEPRMGEDERERLLHEWRRAVERAKGWAALTPCNQASVAGVATPIDEAPGLHRPAPGGVLRQVPRARAHEAGPDWVYRLVRLVLTRRSWPATASARSTSQNVPERGPVLLAPNHFSFWDHFFVAVLLRREVQFMAKSQLFKPPMLASIHQPRRGVPGAPRAARRGGLHHRAHDLRPGRHRC